MVLRDQGPKNTLGFGVTARDLPIPNEQEAADPESSFIARHLHEHPLQKFFAVATATIVGASVASGLVRGTARKGLRGLALHAAENPLSRRGQYYHSYRNVQTILDEYQGVVRIKEQGQQLRGGKLVDFDDPTLDVVAQKKGFFFTQGEKERMRDLGLETPAEWTFRDELQQRLVSQARRLPYELPAAYVSQRLFSDKLLGTGPEEPIDSPLDLIGDFAQQSVKNLAFAFLPFEAGTAAAKHGWRRALSNTVDPNGMGGVQGVAQGAILDMQNSLGLIGQNVSNVVDNAVRYSRRSTGALSTAITETVAKQRHTVDHLHQVRNTSIGSWFKRIAAGEEIPGPVFQTRQFGKEFKKAWKEGVDLENANNVVGMAGYTKLGQMAAAVKHLEEGAFGDALAQAEYSKMVARNLSNLGVKDDVASKFSELFDFVTPQKLTQQTHISRRILHRGEKIFEGDKEWAEAFAEKVEPLFQGHGKVLGSKLSTAINRADKEFIRGGEILAARTQKMWSQSFREVIAPEAKRVLGMRRAAYADFEHMTDEASEFLVRRTAERMGVVTRTQTGIVRSTTELKNELRQLGFDPSNRHELRAFLVTRGDISKPWNPLGLNALGLRPLAMDEAINKGVFKDTELQPYVEKLGKAISETDWDAGILNRIQVGGMYRTAHGGIVDFTSLRRSGRSFLDKASNEAQIPLIHLRPFQMFGAGLKQEIDSQPYIQFSAKGRHPFLATEDQGGTGYFWFRSGRAKGRVARIAAGTDDSFDARFLEGEYRPMPTSNNNLQGRSVRMAIGDTGRLPYEEQSRFREFFKLDDHQPDSLWGAAKRFWASRKGDYRNPANFAQRLLTPGDEWSQGLNPAELASGARRMFAQWRNSSFSRNVMRASRGNPEAAGLGGIFDEVFDAQTGRPLAASKLHAKIKTFAAEDLEQAIPDREMRAVAERARRSLLERWSKVVNPESYLDQPLPQGMRSVGLHRRVDEARMDLMRYLSIRKNVGGNVDDFGREVGKMVDEVDRLFLSGSIGSQEAAEARAALGSIQQTFLSFRTYRGQSDQEHLLSVLGRLRSSEPGESVVGSMRRVIEDTANHGTSGTIARRVKRQFGAAPYEYSGFEYNPFGSETTLTPTFRTAFNKNPAKAVASALGFTTWRDPESFSGVGIASTHLFQRMNNAMSILGLGVDPSSYSGPLGMFMGGMIGKRMLPIYGAGVVAMTADRTLGGYLHNEKDAHGERVYRPFFLGMAGEGLARAQIGMAGILPGGQTAEEKREELFEGEVPVRAGRWWPLGSTPWRGGKIEYYRPSWYRRMKAGYQYTDQTYGSPLERLAFGYDFSPLRPLDPYRWEREHYADRPYPVSGDYFTGPWGPATPFLNATVGRILKPRKMMHEDELQWGMSRFQPSGEFGMAPPSTIMAVPGEPTIAGALGLTEGEGYAGTPAVGQYLSAARGGPAYASGSRAARDQTFQLNDPYIVAAQSGANPRRPSGTIPATAPISPGSLEHQFGEFGYKMSEFAGIYGFAFSAARERLGLGSFETPVPTLAEAGQAYGASRQFWDLNLGGLGDFPTPLEGEYANLELSELVRRFIPKPRAQDFVNPIVNSVGRQHPWLPGGDYFTNFQMGDPYTKVPEGEMRLPGIGYERFNRLHSDETGRYGRIDRFKILADIAPYSNEFKLAKMDMRTIQMTPEEQEEFLYTLDKVESMKRRHEFTPYQYKYSSADELGMGRGEFALRSLNERFRHMDSYFHTKFIPDQTALEDWERNDIYGSAFPQWQHPIRDFVRPAMYSSKDRNPVRAGAGLAIVGHLMGATPRARAVGRMVGGITGFTVSSAANLKEYITGERYIPAERKREIATEEYIDILKYVRALRGFNVSQAAGDTRLANQFKEQMKLTMYGADLYGGTADELAQAIPKRKREHFMEFLNAPEQEREQILSTAGRLERRIYQAAWGMRVEKRPELEDYFADHELPDPSWEGWNPNVGMDLVNIKVLQHQGLNASHLGYYPQQIREANLINPSYPDFNTGTPNVRARLQQLLEQRGMTADIREIPTPYGGTRVRINSGV